jgi:hypothetical protein
MVQVSIDDKMMNKARSLLEGVSDEAIVTAALDGWIVRKENQIDIDQYRGKLHWDAEFAGIDTSGWYHT